MAVNYNQYQVNENAGAEAGYQQLTDAQWKLYLDKYRPLETQLFNEITDPAAAENAAQAAEADTSRIYNATQDMTARRLSRFGAQPDLAEQTSINRNRNLSEALATAKAGNTARTGTIDQNTDLLGNAISIGKDVAATTAQGLGQAASMSQSRESAYQQQKQAYQSNIMSSAVMGAGLGYAVAGTALGAGVGAGAGLLLAMI
jgi:hypothetical protein